MTPWYREPIKHGLASRGIPTACGKSLRPMEGEYSVSSVGSFSRNRNVPVRVDLNDKLIEDFIQDKDWIDPDGVRVYEDWGQFIIDFGPEGMTHLSSIIIEGDKIYGSLRLPEGMEDENDELAEELKEDFNLDKVDTYLGGDKSFRGEADRPHVQFIKSTSYTKPKYYYEFIETVIDNYGEIVTDS